MRLILTDPYSYDVACERVEQLATPEQQLSILFVIDDGAVDGLVDQLSNNGWLGPGTLRGLEDTLASSYRILAGDVLELLSEEFEEKGFQVSTEVVETKIEHYLNQLCAEPLESFLIISLSKESPIKIKSRDERLSVIRE